MGTARNGPTGWSGAKWSQKYGPLAWSVGQVVPEPILQAGQESGGSRNGPAGWSGGQVYRPETWTTYLLWALYFRRPHSGFPPALAMWWGCMANLPLHHIVDSWGQPLPGPA